MSASLKPLYVEEFLAWECAQPERYEFDGIQPVAMTGGGQHVRIITRLIVALVIRVKPPCEVFGTDLKVQPVGRIRYPDASVVCSDGNDTDEIIEPTAVFEVVSPSTALTDRRVKPAEYASIPDLAVYVLLEQDRPEVTVMRRSTGWEPETVAGTDAMLALPEIGVGVAMREIYDR